MWTPVEFLFGLYVLLAVFLTWLLLRWAGRAVAHKRANQSGMPEPVEQLRPKAPETGSGLPDNLLEVPEFLRRAGDMRPPS